MDKLDRLVWTDGLSFTAYGVRVGVRVNDSSVMDQLAECLPPGWKLSASPVVERLYSLIVSGTQAGAGARRFNLLYGDLSRLARSQDIAEILETFESDVRLYVAESARGRVFVHAGVVGWRGRAVVIPGRSFSGKTTLVAELVRAGAAYYSDEYAALDARGRVHPFAKPLSIRDQGTEKQTNYTAKSLGGVNGVKPLPVGLIVVGKYKKGARWRPRQLSAGQSVLELLSNAVAARREPESVLDTLQQVALEARTLKGVRGEAAGIVDVILSELDSDG